MDLVGLDEDTGLKKKEKAMYRTRGQTSSGETARGSQKDASRPRGFRKAVSWLGAVLLAAGLAVPAVAVAQAVRAARVGPAGQAEVAARVVQVGRAERAVQEASQLR